MATTKKKATKKASHVFNRQSPKENPKRKKLKKWECPVEGGPSGSAHHWDIPEAGTSKGKTLMGTCMKCGTPRRFKKTTEYD